MSPLRITLHGLVSGFAASLLLSAIARALPGMDQRHSGGDSEKKDKPLPENPFNPDEVKQWQAREQSPAAAKAAEDERSQKESESTGPAAPASALTLPVAPGPEGLAEQFAHKVASGVFGHDISRWRGPAGMATHLTYGSLWGALFGLIQGSVRASVLPAGTVYGLLVWAAGPAALVPAMKLMPPPWKEPPQRALLLVAAHVAYGLALAGAFETLQRQDA
ncbi:MAG TPA: hypothetical protein VFX49_05655 [Chloroflexota bacterium]|nr:hypothetical protein [Chloroflexota bacterium]